MTLEEAIKRNPFDPNRGNKSAYCRYLRYNVTGWYNLDSKEVRRRWQSVDVVKRIEGVEQMTSEEIDKVVEEIREHCRNNHCKHCEAYTIHGCVFLSGEPNEWFTTEEAESEDEE